MDFVSNLFADLAFRARGGDHEAHEQFRQELNSVMVLMVRQTLRGGGNTSPIGRRILAGARRLTAEQGGVVYQNTEDFVQEVAHTVCDEVVARLQPCRDGLAGGTTTQAGLGATLVGR